MEQGKPAARRIVVELPAPVADRLAMLAELNGRPVDREAAAAIVDHLDRARLRLRAEGMTDEQLAELLAPLDELGPA